MRDLILYIACHVSGGFLIACSFLLGKRSAENGKGVAVFRLSEELAMPFGLYGLVVVSSVVMFVQKQECREDPFMRTAVLN